nr:T9SS type A sorting domain-containing protein [uncultured Psychroserpens sp.]
MKIILIILALLFTTSNFAQDSRLFDNIWYLNDLIIDGTHNIPPTNEEIPFVPLEFIEPNEFLTGICEAGMNGAIIYSANNEFTFDGGIAVLTGGCYDDPSNEDFNGLYVGFWFYTSLDVYEYSITETENNRTLSIINSNGDEAIYGDQLLSIRDFNNDNFSIFPNPVNDILYIQKKQNVNFSKIMIFDFNGRLIQIEEQIDLDDLAVNVQKLNNGIYFISIENDANQVVFAKFVKK